MRTVYVYFLLLCFLLPGHLQSQQRNYWHGIERELRYKPEGDEFVIVNGKNKFNKALYGTHTAFRLETSDMPEFGFFMPNNGGNLKVGIICRDKSLWLNDARYIKSIYKAGLRIYEIKDSLLGDGVLKISVLALSNADGMVMQVSGTDLPDHISLFALFGGADNKRFSRNGDLGVDPPDIFVLKAGACSGNVYTISRNSFVLDYGQQTKSPQRTKGVFSCKTTLKTGSPYFVGPPLTIWNSKASKHNPVLMAKCSLNSEQIYMIIKKDDDLEVRDDELETCFIEAESYRQKIAGVMKIETPDPYISPLGGILSIAADAIWDNCWMHGAVGWRIPLNGWRAAYTGDLIGWHERTQKHFDGYAASQIKYIEPEIAHPAMDSVLHLARARKEWGTPMYSKGYICRNPYDTTKMHHYDMNMCYIDELLWHFNWTGDMDYVRKMWPVLQSHLEWEKRNFDPDNDGLYNAYAAIWASDALYYNSGGVTHASAYNYRANKMAAQIAEKIGMDPAPYKQEAEKIYQAVDSVLWLEKSGWWAEFKDFMGNKMIHPDAAVWTIYHALDSDLGTPFQAYQATRYIDNCIPRIPVLAKDLKEEDFYTISTSDWLPYAWSVNNVAFAEVAHTCLAYWQAGRNDKAFHLFKGAILDGMYMGSSPGNIGQISFYDAARGECYRDFGDPVGMYSRALIQGLYGFLPDLMNNKFIIRPGFPSDWDKASITTPDLDFSYIHNNETDSYEIQSRFKKKVQFELLIKARLDDIKAVWVNGSPHAWETFEAVGFPMIKIICKPSDSLNVKIIWKGYEPVKPAYKDKGISGQKWELTSEKKIIEYFDPQGVLKGVKKNPENISGILTGTIGHRTIFLKINQGSMTWWEPVPVEITEPFEVIDFPEKENLQFVLRNNSCESVQAGIHINAMCNDYCIPLEINPGAETDTIIIPSDFTFMGTNELEIVTGDSVIFRKNLVNWNIKNRNGSYRSLDLSAYWNASVSDIFRKEYLSPRSPYTTLQIPVQGIGEWCHPLHSVEINDSGFRQKVSDNFFNTPMNIPFFSTGDTCSNNISFVSLWDNFPDSMTMALSGKASHLYLLMAGSTNHMQCYIVNGHITIRYTDGSCEHIELINPENWLPIEQDLYFDGFAFTNSVPPPYRIALKNGIVSRNLGKEMNINPDEVYGREINGGAAVIIDTPLNPGKELKSLSIEAQANEVIIGLMSVTLYQ